MTAEELNIYARTWCRNNQGWLLAVDMPTGPLALTWDEIQPTERQHWVNLYGRRARQTWEEFAVKKCRYQYQFVGQDGRIYKNAATIPAQYAYCIIFRLGYGQANAHQSHQDAR